MKTHSPRWTRRSGAAFFVCGPVHCVSLARCVVDEWKQAGCGVAGGRGIICKVWVDRGGREMVCAVLAVRGSEGGYALRFWRVVLCRSLCSHKERGPLVASVC